MKSNLLAAAAALFLLSTPVLAQDSTNAANVEAMSKVTSAADFVAMAAMSDMFEIQSGQMVADRSGSSDAVKQFAQHLVNDHSTSSRDLMALAQEQGVNVQPPAKLDERHQAMIDQLSGADEASHDTLFAQLQVQAHQEGIALFKGYAQNGDNQQLKAFAQKGLPVLEQHLQMAQQMQTQGQTQTQ